jgi:hypothetical protein
MELGDVIFSLITLGLVFIEGMNHQQSVEAARTEVYRFGWRLNEDEVDFSISA